MDTIFILKEFSEDIGPGSSPNIEIKAFKTESGRQQAIDAWVKYHDENKFFEKCEDTPYKYYGSKDWVYWLETEEIELIE
jgi:hypothetical protein